jgi:cytochrome b561
MLLQWRNTATRFGAVAQSLHWLMLALIVFQMVGVQFIDAFPKGSAGRSLLTAAHESAGVLVLLLVAFRLAWRSANLAPAASGPPWQRRLALAGHAALYLLMIAVPVAGYVVASARGHGPAFFGATLPPAMAQDRPFARTAQEVHELLAWTLVALAVAHAAVAIWHHRVLRDDVLTRMLPRRAVPAARS